MATELPALRERAGIAGRGVVSALEQSVGYLYFALILISQFSVHTSDLKWNFFIGPTLAGLCMGYGLQRKANTMIKPRFLASAAALVMAMAAAPAQADIILTNASQGRYNAAIGTSLDTLGGSDPFPCANVACGDATVAFPTAPNLSAAAGVLGSWLTTPATPGGSWTGTQAIPSTWAVNTETAIIYEIAAGAGLTNLSLSLGVDNGIFVWLDGSYLFGARRAGGSSAGEYLVALPDLTAGTHFLQIMREDHGGGTGYDIRLTGDALAVPEPSTLALLGLGLAGLAGLRRRRI